MEVELFFALLLSDPPAEDQIHRWWTFQASRVSGGAQAQDTALVQEAPFGSEVG